MRLRALQDRDAILMLEWMHDPAVNHVFRLDFASMTRDKVLLFIRKGQTATESHYSICDDADTYMGTISLKQIDVVNGTAEYAIVLRQVAQGQGFAGYATREILRIAFEELGLHKVYLNVLKENEHASGFYEHIGFRYEGTQRAQLVIGGRRHDLKWYGLLADEWHAMQS